jgi:hypothetical protein
MWIGRIANMIKMLGKLGYVDLVDAAMELVKLMAGRRRPTDRGAQP